MVVSPKKLDERVRQKVSQEADNLEKKIDEMLEKKIMSRGSTNASIFINSSFGQATPYTVKLVMERYKAAGWDVKWHSDQRDGDYYEFNVSFNYQEGGAYDR